MEKQIVIVLSNHKYLKNATNSNTAQGIIGSAIAGLTGSNSNASATTQPQMQTGFDIREFAHLYKRFDDMKLLQNVVIASPAGGEAPIDDWARRQAEEENDEQVKRIMQQQDVMQKLRRTENCDRVKAENVAAVVLLGGLGALGDYPESKPLQKLLREVWKHGEQSEREPREPSHKATATHKPIIAAISEGTAAFIGVPEIVKGRRLTCTSNDELRQFKLHDKVPVLPEEQLRQAGAKIDNADAFAPKVVQAADNRLITAQNFNSINEFAKCIIEAVEQMHRGGGGREPGQRMAAGNLQQQQNADQQTPRSARV